MALATLKSPLGLAARPRVSPHATLHEGPELVVVADDTTYRFGEPSGSELKRLWPLLDGTRTVAELAETTGVPWQTTSAVLAPLATDNWIIDETAVRSSTDADTFFAAYRALCEFWKKDIFTRPFWQILASGSASRTLVLGWLVEFYHYIDAANEHMPAAVAFCRDDRTVQLWLAQHYTEEYDHNKIFLDGLVAAGLDRDAVATAAPLPSTRALINYITEVASSDTVAYAAMHGIFQAPGSTESWAAVERFYQFLLSHYEFGAGVLKAFRDHAALDAELGHDDLVFARICARLGRFEPAQIDTILRATRGLVEHFVIFFDGIHDYYGDSDVPFPRRSIDIRAAL